MEAHHERNLTRSGTGDLTLVLLHGWGLDRTSWGPLRRIVDAQVETVAYDLYGAGANAPDEDLPPEGSLSRSVAELFEICDRLAGRRLVLVGASRGAMVAIEAAAEQPHRFEALVTLGAPLRGSFAEDYEFGADATQIEALAPQLASNYKGTLAALAPLFYLTDTGVNASALQAAGTMIEEAAARTLRPDIATRILMEHLTEDVRESAARLELPTLVVGMERDATVPAEVGRRFARSVSAARFELLHGAGHVPQLTMPDRVAAVILNFLHKMLEKGDA